MSRGGAGFAWCATSKWEVVWWRTGVACTGGEGARRDSSHRFGEADERAFCGQRARPLFTLWDLVGGQSRKLPVNFLLIRAVTDSSDEKIGAIPDEKTIGLAPLHNLQIVDLHFRTSMSACLTSFS